MNADFLLIRKMRQGEEGACRFSLRQIYAARMALFGRADLLLLTSFCGIVTWGLHFELTKLLVHFLLPMMVTACICFGTLCSNRVLNEAAAIALCMVWSALWTLVTLNEQLYEAITLPLWLAFLGAAVIVFRIFVFRTLNNCMKYWEVNENGIRIE